MNNTTQGVSWYDKPRYQDIRHQVRLGIPQHLGKIEAAKRNIKSSKKARTVWGEIRTIGVALSKIKRGYSIIRRALETPPYVVQLFSHCPCSKES